jgi:hypothetical protein
MAVDVALAEKLLGYLDEDLKPNGRLGKVKRYLAGDHDLPYMPKKAKKEFEHLARRAITNWTPLIPDTFSKGLFCDGYRPAKAVDNSPAWSFWQANGLDARQTIAHRGALEYGASYVLVLPGAAPRRVPVIKPLSPLRSLAWYDDPDDLWPRYGLRLKGNTVEGSTIFEVYDAADVSTFAKMEDGKVVRSKVEAHGLGVTPFVRFRDRFDDEAVGVVRPILTLQDRINEVVFALLIALQYASFRQRWATGLVIPTDDDPDSPTFGEPVESFQAAVDRLWVTDSSEARFGDFAQTEISGHLGLYEVSVKTLAGIAQISPNVLTGDLVNLSAEALAQLQDTTQRKLGEFETLMGESWEQVFRLAAYAAGDFAGAEDTSAQVRWRDTEARSLAQTVDALGKLAQMLEVPVEALWEQVPGITQEDVAYWKALRSASDPIAAVLGETERQSAPNADDGEGGAA